MTLFEATALLQKRHAQSIAVQRHMISSVNMIPGCRGADNTPERQEHMQKYLDEHMMSLWVIWEVELRWLLSGGHPRDLGPA